MKTREYNMSESPKDKETHSLRVFKIPLVVLVLLIVSGVAFKSGVMVAESKKIVCFENATKAMESFYDSSWSVYTTIFGLFGVVLGVIFPMYQSREHRREVEEIKEELNNIKDNSEKQLEELKKETHITKDINESYLIVNEFLKIDRPIDLRNKEEWIDYLEKVSAFNLKSNVFVYYNMLDSFRFAISNIHDSTILPHIVDKIEVEFPKVILSVDAKDKTNFISFTIDIWVSLLDKSYNNDLEHYTIPLYESISNIFTKIDYETKGIIKNNLLLRLNELAKSRLWKSENSDEDLGIAIHTDRFWDENTRKLFSDFIEKIKLL